MGLEVIAVIVVAIAIISVIAPTAFQSFIDSAKQTADDFLTAQSLGVQTNVGDTVCDLKLTVIGTLDFDKTDPLHFLNPLKIESFVYIQKSDITASWFNCFIVGEPSTNSILPALNPKLTHLLSVLTLNDSFDLKMTAETNSGLKLVNSNSQISFTERISIPDGQSITLPYHWKAEYVINDVKKVTYDVSIIALNKNINNLGSNAPFLFSLPG